MRSSAPNAPTVLAIAAAIAIGFGALGVIWVFARALALLVLAVTLAAALQPPVCYLERRMPRKLAVVLMYLVLFGGICLVGYLVLPSIAGDLSQIGSQLPEMANRVSSAVGRVLPGGGDGLPAAMTEFASRLLQVSSGLAEAGFDVLVVIFLSLYFLLAAPDFHDAIVRLAPPRQRRRTGRVLSKMANEMGGYIRGAAINGVVVGALTWVALLVVGVEYAMPLAVLAFFGELVPYLGPIVAAVPAIAVAATQSLTLAVTVVFLYVAIQQIEGHVLTPLIMHSQTHISPALVIVALTMGYTAGGILGALAAIPIFAGGRVLIRHVLAPAVRRRLWPERREERRAA